MIIVIMIIMLIIVVILIVIIRMKIEDKMETRFGNLIATFNEKFDLQKEQFESMEAGTKKGLRHLNSKIEKLETKNDTNTNETKAIATAAREVAKAALDQMDDIKKQIEDLKKKKPSFANIVAGSQAPATPSAPPAAPTAASPFARAPPLPTFPSPGRAEFTGTLPKSAGNDGFTLMACGFPRNCSRDILQDFITKEITGKHEGLHDGKAIYREGSTAYLYFSSRDTLWLVLRNQPTIKYEDKRIWYTYPKSKEERAMSMTRGALKKAILELDPNEKPIVKWDTGQIFIKGMLIARTSPPTSRRPKSATSRSRRRTSPSPRTSC